MDQRTTKQIKTQEAMFQIKTQIRELREVDAKEAARLLNTGEWIATGAALNQDGSVKYFSCGRIGDYD